MELYERLREIPVEEPERAALVEKCQENGWLMRGGFDWQDDPYMEEYPYSFVRTKSMDDLRQFFAHGNWAIRQGILYHDLAFIQQVNGDDEWWTLKKNPQGNWVSFESWTFGEVAEKPAAFSNAIVSMEMASIEQCRSYYYMLPENDFTWSSATIPGNPLQDGSGDLRLFLGENESHKVAVCERPSFGGYSVEVRSKEYEGVVYRDDCFAVALDAAIAACASAGFTYKEGTSEYEAHANLQQHCSRLVAAARELAGSRDIGIHER
jgi:hypothetical protein